MLFHVRINKIWFYFSFTIKFLFCAMSYICHSNLVGITFTLGTTVFYNIFSCPLLYLYCLSEVIVVRSFPVTMYNRALTAPGFPRQGV